MRISHKTALQVLATAAVAAGISACASPGYYDTAYYGNGYYDRDDCSGPYPASYCSYPSYTGTVVIGGAYYDGLRYRDTRFGREYWLRDHWIRGEPTYRYYRRG